MAYAIQAWKEFGPRLESTRAMEADELIELIVAATNQSEGSVRAVLAEMDVQVIHGLKSGRIIHLPNGMRYKPTGKKDGTVDCDVYVSTSLYEKVNSGFRGKWINAANIGKSEAEIIELWNKAHPEDPVVREPQQPPPQP